MIILVTGGRKFNDLKLLVDTLDIANCTVGGMSALVHGDAPGADRMAGAWARTNGVQEVKCPANWDYYQQAAGPIRNKVMTLLNIGAIIAFPGGIGTQNMCKVGEKAGLKVWKTSDQCTFPQFYSINNGIGW